MTYTDIARSLSRTPGIKESLKNKFVANWVFTLAYEQMARKRQIREIESLPQPEKDAIWERAKQVRGELHFSKEDCINLSKALYALEYFLNEKQ